MVRNMAASAVAFEDALQFVDASKMCGSIPDILGLMRRAIAPLGVTRFARVSLLRPGEAPAVGPLVGDYRPDWVSQYAARNFAEHDIVFKSALDSTTPKFWRDWRSRAATKKEREVFEAAADFGSKDGLSVPIHHWRGAAAAVVMHGPDMSDAPEALAFLHLVAIHFNAAVDRLSIAALPREAQGAALTERQIECLRWVAAGKSDWEIGEILGLSEHTVHRHVERAKTRLDVRTRAQAVMAAFSEPATPDL